jgi:hypothetical protein
MRPGRKPNCAFYVGGKRCKETAVSSIPSEYLSSLVIPVCKMHHLDHLAGKMSAMTSAPTMAPTRPTSSVDKLLAPKRDLQDLIWNIAEEDWGWDDSEFLVTLLQADSIATEQIIKALEQRNMEQRNV